MNLKKLELYGFKSFAERTVISFDQGITGIIGPNGSGKSNIADAVRWVLGEQSARTLRGKSMEDVIFGGTEARKPLSYCEVTLVFDNSEGDYPQMGSEIAVSRRVYRSGESEYRLNRAPCRLKTIVDLFRDSGIGREGYSIIGQGRVDEILSNRAEDRRNVFHEAAGIMKFRSRKEEAERRLEAAQENLARLGDIMKVLSDRLEPLAQQSVAARKYLDMSRELKELELNRFLFDYRRLQQAVAEAQAGMAQSEQVLEQQERDLEERRREVETLHAQGEVLESQEQAKQEAILALTREEEQARGGMELTTQRIDFLAQDHDRMQEQLEQEAARRAETLAKADALSGELARRQEKASADARSIEEQENRLAAMDQQIDSQEAELETRKQRYIDSLSHHSNIKSERTRLETLRESIAERLDELEARCQEYLDRNAATQEELDGAEGVLTQMQASTAELAADRKKAQEGVERLRARQAACAQEMNHIRERLQTSKTRHKMLQDMKRDYEGYNNTIKQLLQDARRDPALGQRIENVVAELLHVPKQYTVAIEVALGGALQNIVTATEEDAKYAIDYLRRRQYGRATFLPLSAVKARELSREQRHVLAMEGCCGVASELISYDAKYHGIVSNLLGRTILAQNMDAAIAIARACGQSLRIVTLQGDMINAGGAMTGGSIRSKFTSILTREKELEELTAALKELQRRYEAAVDQETLLKEEAAVLASQCSAVEEKQNALSVECARQESLCRQLRANMERREVHRQEALEQIGTLRASREQVLQDLEANLQRENHLTNQDASLQEDTQKLQLAITELREERDGFQETLTAARAAQLADAREDDLRKKEHERLVQEAQRLLDTMEEQRQAYETSQGEVPILRQRLQDEEARAQGLLKDLEAAREALAQTQEQRRRLREETSGREQELQDREKEKLQLEAKRDQYELQRQRFDEELTSLQNRIWDTYEVTYAQAEDYAVEGFSVKEAVPRIERLRREIRGLGQVNVRAVEDYAACKEQLEDHRRQWEDLTSAKSELESLIGSLAQNMQDQFLENFAKINKAFSKTFTRLFGGGTAQLSLSDQLNVLESGIEIRVQPPGKKLQLLSLLSGGERALTAIALLFAMLEMHPTPFCILDEIEAALDEANIYNFSQYLREYSQKTQFVIITHRKTTMESADILYGVTMQEKGVSRLLSVRMGDLVKEVS